MKHLKRFQLNSKAINNQSVDLYFYIEAKKIFKNLLQQESLEWLDYDMLETISLSNQNIEIEDLLSFDINNDVDTEALLSSLVFSQLNDENDKIIKKWLDRLVQRFEVTKKLYVNYSTGFRKGKGVTDNVNLYWLFALSLSLYFFATNSIKYLSALLKVTDLLCSLDNDVLVEKIPLQGISMILQVEMFSIRSITDTIEGVDFVYS